MRSDAHLRLRGRATEWISSSNAYAVPTACDASPFARIAACAAASLAIATRNGEQLT
jgi:hypothetical protein